MEAFQPPLLLLLIDASAKALHNNNRPINGSILVTNNDVRQSWCSAHLAHSMDEPSPWHIANGVSHWPLVWIDSMVNPFLMTFGLIGSLCGTSAELCVWCRVEGQFLVTVGSNTLTGVLPCEKSSLTNSFSGGKPGGY